MVAFSLSLLRSGYIRAGPYALREATYPDSGVAEATRRRFRLKPWLRISGRGGYTSGEALLVGPSRLHGLIDGVFAIALTLLVLDLPRPRNSTRLGHDLLHAWPTYAAYLVSFLTVGIVWIEHHGMMAAVERINRRFLERTLLFLLFVSIIPWPTAIAADSVDHGSQAEPAAVLYAVIMLLMGLSFSVGWRYLAEHPNLVAEPARPALRAGMLRALVGGLVYIASIAIAFVNPDGSFALDALIALYFAASRTGVPGLINRAPRANSE